MNIDSGTSVRGTYCNVPFAGIVNYARRNTRTGYAEYSVKLDSPIVVLGDERTTVIVTLGMRHLPCTIEAVA
jgi:hypothetical protein